MTFEFIGLLATVYVSVMLWFRLMRWLFPMTGPRAAGFRGVYIAPRRTLMDEMRERELERICRWGKR